MSLRLRVAKRTKNLLVLACLIGVGEAEAEAGVAVNIPETAEQQLPGRYRHPIRPYLSSFSFRYAATGSGPGAHTVPAQVLKSKESSIA